MVKFLKVLTVIVVVVVIVGVVAVVVAPTVTLRNMCGGPIALPGDIPFVGRELKVGDTQVKAPPGDYQMTRSGSNMRIVGPVGIDITVQALQGGFSITQDGRTIDMSGDSQKVTLGINSNVTVVLCTSP